MASLMEALKPAEGGVVSLVGAGGKTTLMFRLAREISALGQTVLTTTTTKIFLPTRNQSEHLILSTAAGDIIQKARRLLKINPHVSAAKGKIEARRKLEGYPSQMIAELWKSKLFRWIIVEADGARQKPLKTPGRFEPVIPLCSHMVIGIIGLEVVGKPLGKKWVFRHEKFAEITKLDVGTPIGESAIAMSILHQQGIMKGSPLEAARVIFLNQADVPGGLEIGRNIRDVLVKRQRNLLNRIVIGNVRYDPPVLEYVDLD